MKPTRIQLGNLGVLVTRIDDDGEVYQTLTIETSGNTVIEVKSTSGLLFSNASELDELRAHLKELDNHLSG